MRTVITLLNAPEYGPLFHLQSGQQQLYTVLGNALQALEAVEGPHMEHQEREELLRFSQRKMQGHGAVGLTMHDIIDHTR